jgi:hypothetical protein
MPVEIRELLIKGRVGDAASGTVQRQEATPTTETSESGEIEVVERISHALRRQLVEDCVLEVMEQLQKNQRL